MQVFVIFIIMIGCRPTPAARETSTRKAHKLTHKCLHLAAFARHSKSWTWTVRVSECRQSVRPSEEEQRVVRTFSLNMMLPHLNPLLRNSGKHRRPRHRSRVPRTELDRHHHHHHHRATLIPAERRINPVTHLMLRRFAAHRSRWRRGKIRYLLPRRHQTHCKPCRHFGKIRSLESRNRLGGLTSQIQRGEIRSEEHTSE